MFSFVFFSKLLKCEILWCLDSSMTVNLMSWFGQNKAFKDMIAASYSQVVKSFGLLLLLSFFRIVYPTFKIQQNTFKVRISKALQ